MTRVGVVGLDTSHPPAFAEYIHEETTATIEAVWDGGDVRDDEFTESFCERFGATRYEQPTGMRDAVDAVMVLTVNWDTHRELAVPFLEAGVPTFVDKPMAGRLEDVEAIAAAATDAPLLGGSAIPYHPTIDDLPTGVPGRTLYTAGYNDPFYYGVHLVDTVRRLAATDWSVVESEPTPHEEVTVRFDDESTATLRLDGPSDDGAFGILDVGDRTRARLVDGDADAHQRMYASLLDGFLEAVREGESERDRLVDGASLLLAVHAVVENGYEVTPGDEALRQVHVDGSSFLADYAPYA
jgi:predicted dehydrogenase